MKVIFKPSIYFEFIFRELFWKKAFSNFSLTIGRVIDNRGVNDFFQITDKLSPINRANYFFAEPKEAKLGQNMIRLEYYSNGFEAGFILIPYSSFDRVTDFAHPYAIIPNQNLNDQQINREVTGSIYLNKFFSKAMISMFAGRFSNLTPIIQSNLNLPDRLRPTFYELYESYWSAGIAGNIAFEPFLLKFESVFNFNKPLQTSKNNYPSGYIRKNELEFSVGADYNMGNEGMITFEILSTEPTEFDPQLTINRSVPFAVIAYSGSFYNDQLKINAFTFFAESFSNMINRIQLEYMLTDYFSAMVKYTLFNMNKYKVNYGYMNNFDRIDIGFNLDFNFE